jgi:DNA-binding FadR family transcriptional regulator
MLMVRAGKLVEAEAPDVEEFKRHELSSHRELYNVVRSRDPIATREAITKHISGSEDQIVKAFQRAD